MDSAGTSDYHIGRPPDARMIETAHSYGLDISNFAARQFITSDFDKFDKIFVMDSENYKNVLALAKNKFQLQKVHYTLANKANVPDPYFGGNDGFIQVYEMLYEACQKINHEIQ